MIINADVLEWAARYEGERYSAILCDPPYHLTSITKRFGGPDAAPAQFGKDGAFQRASRGFMNAQWDGGDIAFRPETWAALGNLLHPGAFGMAFASTRGWHRLACAIEDAGMIIHPSVFKVWAYGSGFPKATRINDPHFDGHRYGLQALKPSSEPIVTFSKPDICYNNIQRTCSDISLMLEGLWKRLADTAETIITAEQTVRSVLYNAATTTERTVVHTSVKDVALNSREENQILKKAGEPIAQTTARMQKPGNGTTAPTAEPLPINGPLPSQNMPDHPCTVVESAIQSTETNFVSENASTAEDHSPQTEKATTDNTAQMSVGTPPKSDPCLKTHYVTATDTDTRVDILRYNLARARFDLSTIWLWSIIWGDLCNQVNTSITATELKTTTILQTLNSSLLRLMLSSQGTALERSSSVELWSYAAPVNAHFIGLLTCLKERRPSVATAQTSPVVVFQRPYEGRPLDCITRTGAGALNIDGGRVACTDKTPFPVGARRTGYSGGMPANGGDSDPAGRWPPNLALIHSPDCNGACVEGCPVRVMGEQSGEREGGKFPAGGKTGTSSVYGSFSGNDQDAHPMGDTGTAARYFPNFDWMLERLEVADPFLYCAKASTTEREAGLADWQRTTVDDGRQTPIDNPYLRGETERRNIHPTVKNLVLCKWLATLLLPPAPYAPRRLLVPFAGVASEMIGAHLAGWEHIDGIELGAGHCAIARARFDWWQTAAARLMTTDPAAILALRAQAVQASLFSD